MNNKLNYKEYLEAKEFLAKIEDSKTIINRFEAHRNNIWRKRRDNSIYAPILYDPYMKSFEYYTSSINKNRLILNKLEYEYREKPNNTLDRNINFIRNQLLLQRKEWFSFKKNNNNNINK